MTILEVNDMYYVSYYTPELYIDTLDELKQDYSFGQTNCFPHSNYRDIDDS